MPPTLTPEQRAAISRANGAKSRGPLSEQGKASSSRNALQSGAHSAQILNLVQPHCAVTSLEDAASFDLLLHDLLAAYQPANLPAQYIVQDIAAARWSLERLNTYIVMCWDRVFEQAEASPAPTELEANVRAVTALYGANPVVTRLTRETARLQRQIAALERQLVYIHKHFDAQPIPDTTATPAAEAPSETHAALENEPTVTTTDSDPAVIAAYRSQFPKHRIVILPPSQDDEPASPPVPRRAA